jgi:hypothetical protein
MSGSLCQSFRDLGAQTWHRLEAAAQTGLAWSEETNTETLLLELRQRHPGAIKIVSFTKAREAKNGSDWEWWIGGTNHWCGMRVQAKRMSRVHQEFPTLQSYRARSAPLPQIDMLIQAARRDRLTPIYCLYVFDPARPSGPGGNPRYPQGCLIGHAEAIRHSRSSTVRSLAHLLQPWHQLVCPADSFAPTTNLAREVFAVLRTLQAGTPDDRPVDEGPALFDPVTQLPPHMQQLQRSRADGGVRDASALFQEANAIERGIRGLVLIDGSEMFGC